ncbi:CHRD domain-containing protein [Sphingomonas jatrophae]|uniref:CHRD domain-containing protein n=1 Tax=Sphingomonas jatrophae TaxID=1166337 RepID=A0A1I6JNE3_9SPHN|nr:CHRD domain-containing protein [Sphingomonas jatrophae]SFR80467.1 CHRD domain-containing protein [Sphingomonas jatrophae]
MRAVYMLLAIGSAAPAIAAPDVLKATMTGASEVPGPGADKGTGTAKINLNAEAGQVCYTLKTKGTDTPTMAHIHKGAVGVAGPPVVPLDAPGKGTSKGCVSADAGVISAILAAPSDYYVNVHSAAFPKGAVRGQLGK